MGDETPNQYRVGAYPLADEVYMFGDAWKSFAEAMNESRKLSTSERAAWVQPTFQNLIYWALPKLDDDSDFQKFYSQYGKRELGTDDMWRIAGECRRAWYKANAWGRPQARPFDVEDAVALPA